MPSARVSTVGRKMLRKSQIFDCEIWLKGDLPMEKGGEFCKLEFVPGTKGTDKPIQAQFTYRKPEAPSRHPIRC